MKKLFKLVVTILTIFVISCPAFTEQVWVNANCLNVRSSPAILNTNIIDRVSYGTELTKIKEVGAWTKIEYEEDVFAYVFSEYVQTEEIVRDATLYTAAQFQYLGVVYYNGWRWTWYSEKVLPGPGLNIPGRHVDGNGYVCDENDFLCIATYELAQGTIVDTPFGKKGKVYDTGCPYGTLDVYTSW